MNKSDLEGILDKNSLSKEEMDRFADFQAELQRLGMKKKSYSYGRPLPRAPNTPDGAGAPALVSNAVK